MIEIYEKTEKCTTVPGVTLTLPLDLRQKSRQRVVLDDGREAGLFLKRGTVLHDDDLLLSTDKLVVRVKAASEKLSVARCGDPLLFAKACYHLGNRHMPLQIEKGRIFYLHDHVLDDMLRGLGLEVEQVNAPFAPEAGAYGGQAGNTGHHHAH
jgi:urease accessory protein